MRQRRQSWARALTSVAAAVGLTVAGVTTPAHAQIGPGGVDPGSLTDAPAPLPDPIDDLGVVSPAAPMNSPGAPLTGLVDAHAHLIAGEAFGGTMRCGRPFAHGGMAEALADCPPHSGLGHGALLEAIVGGNDLPMGTQGFPHFTDWPQHDTLLHEQAYYRGIERAYEGGVRIINNYLVENRVICELYPAPDKHSCDEMDSIRHQANYLREMEAYIDAQHGGPGEGWFRIARSPEEARRIVEQDKLAVTMGVEISEPFGCRTIHGQPACTAEDIDRGLDEFRDMGIMTSYVIHKFDNALGGVHFDSDFSGAAINVGNVLSAGHFWQTGPCETAASDNPQPLVSDEIHALLTGGNVDLPAGVHVPVYPSGPQCNIRGLSDLGRHMVHGMIDRGILINIDHMSVRAARDTLDIVEARDYPGVVTDHTWNDPENIHRVRDIGGFMASYAFDSHAHGDSDGFVHDWLTNTGGQPVPGYGFGSDVNGLGPQADPLVESHSAGIEYPFRAVNGAVLDRPRLGTRTFDINHDGVAYYGMYPDWVTDVLNSAGEHADALREQLMSGPEHYISLWESVR